MSWCGQWKASSERYNWYFIIKVWRGFGGAPGSQLPITDSQSTHQALCTQLWLVRAEPRLSALPVGSPIVCQLPEGAKRRLRQQLVCQYLLLILVPICLHQSILGTAGDGFFPIGVNRIQVFLEVDHTALNFHKYTNQSSSVLHTSLMQTCNLVLKPPRKQKGFPFSRLCWKKNWSEDTK